MTTETTPSLTDALARSAGSIEMCLEFLLPLSAGPEARLLTAMRYSVLGGGKRLRGFLVMEGASLFGVSETCAARVAASVEMLHAYSLVHDDLPAMDDDDLRRGKPSSHKAFDEATAILAGDALQARAFEVLAEPDTHSDPQARCELVAALGAASGARGMAGGQMIDMLAAGRTLDAAEVTRLQSLKTGRLIQYSAEAGAILGRARAASAASARGLRARSRGGVPDRRRSARRRGHRRGNRQTDRQGRSGGQGHAGLDPRRRAGPRAGRDAGLAGRHPSRQLRPARRPAARSRHLRRPAPELSSWRFPYHRTEGEWHERCEDPVAGPCSGSGGSAQFLGRAAAPGGGRAAGGDDRRGVGDGGTSRLGAGGGGADGGAARGVRHAA